MIKMMSNKSELSIGILIILISVLVLFLVPKNIQGGSETGKIMMNLTITKSIGLSLSNRLATNITFTNSTCATSNLECPIIADGVTRNNATYNNVTGIGNANGTNYSVSNSGNTFEDICAIAVGNLTCAPAQGCGNDMIIMKGNATWENTTIPNGPLSPGLNEWTGDYASANDSAAHLANGGIVYLRFWLRVPTSIVPGNYNTTYKFCAVESGTTCTC
jgi:hypothetical protein